MAAPSSTVWGSVASSGKGKIGINYNVSGINDSITVTIDVWFWSRYSVTDENNTFCFNDNATSATTSKGSRSIKNTSDSSWSTSNQKRIYTYSYKPTLTTAAQTKNCAAKLSGIDVISGTMTVTTSYTIPALPSYKITYNANGGSNAPANQTKYYGKNIQLRSETPTRDGYVFVGWSTNQTATVANYGSGDTYTDNKAITLYAVWAEAAFLQTIKARYQNIDGSWGEYNTVYSAALQSGEFVEWSQDYSVEFKGVSIGYTVTETKTTYVDIERNTYKVYLNANGGIANVSSVQYFYGGTLYLNRRPTRSGYTFLGWSTNKNATEPLYTVKTAYDTLNISGETLYAIWEKRNFVNIYLQNDCIAQAGEYVEDTNTDFKPNGVVCATSFIEESTSNNFTINENFVATAFYESIYTKSFLVDNYDNMLTDNSGNYFYVEVEEQHTDNSVNDTEGDTELSTDVNLLSSDEYKLMSSDDLYLIAQQGGN